MRSLLLAAIGTLAALARVWADQVIVEVPPPGCSNLTYYIHAQIPPVPAFSLLGLTTNRTFDVSNPQPGAVYAGVALGQSNKLWLFIQLGLAVPDPAPTITNRMIRLASPPGALALEAFNGTPESGLPRWQRLAVLNSTSPPVQLPQGPQQTFRAVRTPPLPR